MDRAYEDGNNRFTAQMLKFDPVVPPKSNRKNPREYDKELCGVPDFTYNKKKQKNERNGKLCNSI